MSNIAIIPARSGSKGLEDKNIKELNGKPLIAYTIEAALETNLFDEVFVSTNSESYAEIAKEFGANVPFLRDENLSTDTVSTWEVVNDALLNYEKNGRLFKSVALLQPTSPLRGAGNIVDGYKVFNSKNANAVIGICETDHSPLWCNTLPKDDSMQEFLPDELLTTPRQNLPKYYRINGAIYIVKTDYLKSNFNIYAEKCYGLKMPKENSVDIDDILDFRIAEAILLSLKSEM